MSYIEDEFELCGFIKGILFTILLVLVILFILSIKGLVTFVIC